MSKRQAVGAKVGAGLAGESSVMTWGKKKGDGIVEGVDGDGKRDWVTDCIVRKCNATMEK
jgi:hypothetical protein